MNWLRIMVFIVFFTIVDTAVYLIQYGVCHLLGRWWFGARGSYVGILRPIWLGSVVVCAYVIPYVGPVIGGVWMLAILMRVFEEIDGIERMKAFALAYGTGAIIFVLNVMLATPKK